MPFIGVRISWLTVARNCVFALVAASAVSFARVISNERFCSSSSVQHAAQRTHRQHLQRDEHSQGKRERRQRDDDGFQEQCAQRSCDFELRDLATAIEQRRTHRQVRAADVFAQRSDLLAVQVQHAP
jgi:hypothetical protein